MSGIPEKRSDFGFAKIPFRFLGVILSAFNICFGYAVIIPNFQQADMGDWVVFSLFAILAIGISTYLIWSIHQILVERTTKIGEEGVSQRQGLLFARQVEIPWSSIRQIRLNHWLSDWSFKDGEFVDIKLQGVGGTIRFSLDLFPQPVEFVNYLVRKIQPRELIEIHDIEWLYDNLGSPARTKRAGD